MITQTEEKIKQNLLKDITYHKNFAEKVQHQLSSFLLGAKGERVEQCGNYLVLANYKDPNYTTTLHSANFCKNKLCPFCSWRTHLKIYEAMGYAVEQQSTKNLYHMVLTIPNVKYLTKEFLLEYNKKAVNFIRKYLQSNNYIKSFEITIGKDNSFHPHFHILLELDNLPALRDLRFNWAKFLGIKRNWAMLHIERAKENTLSELTKYIVKFESLDCQTNNLKIIYFATKNLRRFSLAGDFKKYYKFATMYLEKNRKDTIKELLKYGNPELEYYKWLSGTYVKNC